MLDLSRPTSCTFNQFDKEVGSACPATYFTRPKLGDVPFQVFYHCQAVADGHSNFQLS